MKALKPKTGPNYGPRISDTCHILVKDTCISYCLLLQQSEQHKCLSCLK